MVWAPIWATVLISLTSAPSWAQRDGQRTQASIAQDAMNAVVDAANRANSVDPTSPFKIANHADPLHREWSLTPLVARSLRQAQTDMREGRAESALDAVLTAQKNASRQYDRLKTYQYLALVHLRRNDEQAAAAAAEAAADMPELPDGEKKEIYTSAALLALNAAHYDKALRYGQAMQALGMDDAPSRLIIGQALYFGGEKIGAIEELRKQIESDLAAARKPDRAMLEIVMSAQSQMRNPADAQQTLDLLKQYYGDPRNWQQIIELMHQLDIWDSQSRTNDLRAKNMLPGGT